MDLTAVEELVPAPGVTWRDGDAFLAGGSYLFSEPQPAVRRLLDLRDYGWPAIVEHEDGLEVAATCTLARLAAFESGPPIFGQCCAALLGSFKVWNVATVGGNICCALPAGPMTSLTASLDGVATTWAPDGSSRELPVLELVTGPGRTALAPGELLRSVFLPRVALDSRTAFRQLSLSAMGRSATVVIGRVGDDGAVVTVSAATPRPVQLRFARLPGADEVVAAFDEAVTVWFDDVHGSPRWRRAITRRLLGEVVEELS